VTDLVPETNLTQWMILLSNIGEHLLWNSTKISFSSSLQITQFSADTYKEQCLSEGRDQVSGQGNDTFKGMATNPCMSQTS
jgi:hypothetical protein